MVKVQQQKNIKYKFSINKVSIKISSFNKNYIFFFLYRMRRWNRFYSLFKLPSRVRTFTLLRSPFVNKKSRIQLGYKLYIWKVNFDFYDFEEDFSSFRREFNLFLLGFIRKGVTTKSRSSTLFYRFSNFF